MTSNGGTKKLGAFLATMLVAGNMIGSGIYLLPSSLGAVGSISILGWVAAVCGAAFLGAAFSALTVLRPDGTGLISHVSLAALVYISACAAIMGILPAADLAASGAPFADAAKPLVGASLAAGVALCAMLKASGTVGGWILVSAETWGADEVLGLMLRRKPARRNGGPSIANLLFNGALMSVAAIATANPSLGRQFTVVADISVILCMFLYGAACVALIALTTSLRTRLLAGGAILFCGWVAAVSEIELLLWSLATIAIAILAYLPLAWWRRRSIDSSEAASVGS